MPAKAPPRLPSPDRGSDALAERHAGELIVRGMELLRFLRGFGEQPWADWLERRLRRLRSNRHRGVAELLDGYRGIGAIVDLYICPEARHRVDARDEAAVNEQLLILLSRLYAVARQLGDHLSDSDSAADAP